jgi:membrane protein
MPATDIRTALTAKRKSQDQQSWWQMLKTAASEWVQDDAMTWAAAIACYVLLALAPMFVIAVKVGTLMLGGQANAITSVQKQAADWMGPAVGDAVASIIDQIVHRGGGHVAAAVSVILIVLSVGGVFSEVQLAMNRVWQVKTKPGQAVADFVRARLKSIVVMTIAAIVLVASVFVTTWLQNITDQLGLGLKYITLGTDLLVSLGVLTLLFAMIYKTMPDAEIRWSTTGLGAFITAVLFTIGRYGLAIYFKFAAPTSVYGAAGSLAAVLIWIYYSAQIVLFGAVFTQVYAKVRGEGVRPSKHAEFLSNCDETETATPSSEPPRNKPSRSAVESSKLGRSNYGTVLGKYLNAANAPSRGSAHQRASGHVNSRDFITAAAGLVLGVVAGAYGASRTGKPRLINVTGREVKPPDGRAVSVEAKLARAARVMQYLQQDNVNQELDAIKGRLGEVSGRTTKHRVASGRRTFLKLWKVLRV